MIGWIQTTVYQVVAAGKRPGACITHGHENVPASVNNVLKSRRRRLSVARDRRGCGEQQADGRGDRRRRSPPGTNPRSVKVSARGSGDAHRGGSESF